MDCVSKAFAQLLTHHADHERLLDISRELHACLHEKQRRCTAMQELDNRVEKLIEQRQDADARLRPPSS
jgi:hypothetical protein